MASAISVIMMILIGLVGGVPTLAITACIPVMIVWKIYRKVKSIVKINVKTPCEKSLACQKAGLFSF